MQKIVIQKFHKPVINIKINQMILVFQQVEMGIRGGKIMLRQLFKQLSLKFLD
jgi:hypothetical protein